MAQMRRRGWAGSPPADDAEARERIVAAAAALITETDAPVSIAQVAGRLGVIRQTVYRYFPTAEELMRAAAIAAVDEFLDRLADHVAGLTDPAEAVVEAIVFTLSDVHRIPPLDLLLAGDQALGVTSPEARAFGMTMIYRFDVDWAGRGFTETDLAELVEFQLRTMQSFFLSPADPEAGVAGLRRYLHRWVGAAVAVRAGDR